MPTKTLPFSVSILSKIQARSQSVHWKCNLGEVREFRAYCCNINSNGIMGVAKEPVIILRVSPQIVCLGAAITWDLTDSYAPGSTIDNWSIDFGDGDGDTGGSIGSAFGTHTYAGVGIYTIIAFVSEGGGRNQEVKKEVQVIDCSSEEVPIDWEYVSTEGGGVYFIDWNADVPTWVQKNNGLTGNALYARSIVIDPRSRELLPSQHKLWLATQGGVYFSSNGGNSWDRVIMGNPSNLEFGDSPAATEDVLDFYHIIFDYDDPDIVYIIATN